MNHHNHSYSALLTMMNSVPFSIIKHQNVSNIKHCQSLTNQHQPLSTKPSFTAINHQHPSAINLAEPPPKPSKPDRSPLEPRGPVARTRPRGPGSWDTTSGGDQWRSGCRNNEWLTAAVATSRCRN